jgi:hypothetical protein
LKEQKKKGREDRQEGRVAGRKRGREDGQLDRWRDSMKTFELLVVQMFPLAASARSAFRKSHIKDFVSLMEIPMRNLNPTQSVSCVFNLKKNSLSECE